jgi:NADH-ubiquinone oxidoreductase chain 5
MLTAFYSMRLLYFAFIEEPKGDIRSYTHAHEPGLAMSLPLFFLAIASIFIGFIMKDLVIGPGSPYIEFQGSYTHMAIESEFIPVTIK